MKAILTKEVRTERYIDAVQSNKEYYWNSRIVTIRLFGIPIFRSESIVTDPQTV